jgi:hypothetical protein
MMSPFSAGASRVFTAFVSRFRQNPFALNCTIGCVLCAGSDAIAQQIEQNPNGFVRLISKDHEDVDATSKRCQQIGTHGKILTTAFHLCWFDWCLG